jgi:type I restriction enzyme S subunit
MSAPVNCVGMLVRDVRETCRPTDLPDVPYVGLEHISPGSLRAQRRARSDSVESLTKRFQKGDILFGTLRPYFRKVARPDFDGVCSPDIAVLRPIDERDAWFAFYTVASPAFIAHATATSNGTRMPRAKWSVLSAYRIPDLSPAQRYAVGRALSQYDALIANNAKRVQILEDLPRALYQEWFGVAGVQKTGTRCAAQLFGDIVDDVRDAIDPTEIDPGTPYFGLEHLPRRSTTLFDWGRAADVQSTKLLVRRGDILFGKIRPYFHKVGASPVDAISSSDAVVLRPKDDTLRALALACASSDDFVARATASSQGTKMPRANWDVMRRYPVVAPDAALLRRFNSVAAPAADLAAALGLATRTLATTRDLLLPGLISGEVSVREGAR